MDEWWMLDIFKRLSLNDDDILLDIGANVGQTLIKWKAVNSKSPCYCVDALPACSEYLDNLVAVNKFRNCKILNYAVSDSTGTATLNLHFDEEADRTASLHESKFQVIKQIDVNSISFHTLLNQIEEVERIRLVKIDVEGGELDILKGMEGFLSKNKPILIVEILSSSEEYIKEVNELLQEFSSNIYQIIKRDLRLDHLKLMEAIPFPNPIELSDYVIIPH